MFIRSCLVEMVQEEKICGPDRLSSEPKCHLVPMVTRRETCGIQILTTVVSYNGCEYLILVHRRLTSNFCPVVLRVRDPVRRRHEFTFKPGVMRGCGPNPHWHSTCIAIVIFFWPTPPAFDKRTCNESAFRRNIIAEDMLREIKSRTSLIRQLRVRVILVLLEISLGLSWHHILYVTVSSTSDRKELLPESLIALLTHQEMTFPFCFSRKKRSIRRVPDVTEPACEHLLFASNTATNHIG